MFVRGYEVESWFEILKLGFVNILNFKFSQNPDLIKICVTTCDMTHLVTLVSWTQPSGSLCLWQFFQWYHPPLSYGWSSWVWILRQMVFLFCVLCWSLGKGHATSSDNFRKRLENTLESSSSTTSNSFIGGMIPNQPYSKAIKLLSNQKIWNKETKQICKRPKNMVGLNFFGLPTSKKLIETPHLVDFASVGTHHRDRDMDWLLLL